MKNEHLQICKPLRSKKLEAGFDPRNSPHLRQKREGVRVIANPTRMVRRFQCCIGLWLLVLSGLCFSSSTHADHEAGIRDGDLSVSYRIENDGLHVNVINKSHSDVLLLIQKYGIECNIEYVKPNGETASDYAAEPVNPKEFTVVALTPAGGRNTIITPNEYSGRIPWPPEKGKVTSLTIVLRPISFSDLGEIKDVGGLQRVFLTRRTEIEAKRLPTMGAPPKARGSNAHLPQKKRLK